MTYKWSPILVLFSPMPMHDDKGLFQNVKFNAINTEMLVISIRQDMGKKIFNNTIKIGSAWFAKFNNW